MGRRAATRLRAWTRPRGHAHVDTSAALTVSAQCAAMFQRSSTTKTLFQMFSMTVQSLAYSSPVGSICFSMMFVTKLPMIRKAIAHCTLGFL